MTEFSSPSDHFERAEELRIAGKPAQAIVEYTTVISELETGETLARAYHMRGVAEGMRGNWEPMLSDTAISLLYYKDSVDGANVYRDRGKAWYNLGDFKAAKSEIDDAIYIFTQAGRDTEYFATLGFRARMRARQWAVQKDRLARQAAHEDFELAVDGLRDGENREWELYNIIPAATYEAIEGKYFSALRMIDRAEELSPRFGNKTHVARIIAAKAINPVGFLIPSPLKRRLTKSLIR